MGIIRKQHSLKTMYDACKEYSEKKSTVRTICRRFEISKASLMRWMIKFDGTRESLRHKSRRPKSFHPTAHRYSEVKSIKLAMKENPDAGICELYGILKRNYNYKRHPGTLFKILKKIRSKEIVQKPKYELKPYETPENFGEKMQMDVKYVPVECYKGEVKDKFYQYTMIDEATRERFLFAYKEITSESTIDFVVRAISYFGYKPKVIQTDNGFEFTNWRSPKKHNLIRLCKRLNIEHKLIRPYTPQHNGKVERTHRNDNERFYNKLTFETIEELRYKMKDYLIRSNNIPSRVLKWLSPLEKRRELTMIKHFNEDIKSYINENIFRNKVFSRLIKNIDVR